MEKNGVIQNNVSIDLNSFYKQLGLEDIFWFKGGGGSTNVKETWVRHIKPKYDIVVASCPKGWRLPTIAEWMELYHNTKFEVVKINSKKYIRVDGKNKNSIIIPANGFWGTDDTSSKSKKSKHQNKDQWDYMTSDQEILKLNENSSQEGDWLLSPEEMVFYTSFHAYEFRNKITGFASYSHPWNGLFVRAVYDPSLADNENNDDKKVDPKPEPKPEPVVEKNKPELTLINLPESMHSPNLNIKVGVKSKSTITGTTIYVNGQVLTGIKSRGVKSVNNDGYDMVIDHDVILNSGKNSIRVEVTNADETTSVERTVNYMPVVVEDKKEDAQELRRVAFVVGNSNYPGNELPNPKNDAVDIAAKLRSLGFEVITLIDGTKRQIEDKTSEFARRAADADVAMFFYAGHGIQSNGANYLIPVDAVLRSAKDIEYECTDVNRVLANMEESGCRMNIVALDACRNNPFERGWYRGSINKGLSVINAPIGTFISYATSPGSVAADGTDRNSPYTNALLKALDKPGLTIEGVFKNVGSEVVKTTERRQTPWYSSSLYQGEFIFNPAK